MTAPLEVADAAELLSYVELTDIRVNELIAKRVESPAGSEDNADSEDKFEEFQVRAGVGDEFLETAARLEVVSGDARLLVDISAIFAIREKVNLSSEVVREFVERVGVMAVYPFVREHIFSMARQLGVQAPLLGLLRAGQFNLEAGE